MPWSNEHFPPAMGHLPFVVREKAIEFANALLWEVYKEGRAIRVTIAQAKRGPLLAASRSSYFESLPSTNPKPRGCPVSRSVIRFTDSTVPCWPNSSRISLSLVENGRFPT